MKKFNTVLIVGLLLFASNISAKTLNDKAFNAFINFIQVYDDCSTEKWESYEYAFKIKTFMKQYNMKSFSIYEARKVTNQNDKETIIKEIKDYREGMKEGIMEILKDNKIELEDRQITILIDESLNYFNQCYHKLK